MKQRNTDYPTWTDLIGKKVLAYRGYQGERKVITLSFILFDDKETFIELDEQCPVTYHDASRSARQLTLRKDAERWQEIFTDLKEPKHLGNDPF